MDSIDYFNSRLISILNLPKASISRGQSMCTIANQSGDSGAPSSQARQPYVRGIIAGSEVEIGDSGATNIVRLRLARLASPVSVI